MPEKYELFLDKNKKVKLAANDQGDFFAEANGNRIKLGEQGLQTINKTTGAPESVGGAPDPNQTISSITGVTGNGFGEDSGRTTFTHSDLPGETLVGWYATEWGGGANRPRLFLQVNSDYINGSILSDANGNVLYNGDTGSPGQISLKINGNVYGPTDVRFATASWYSASQINFSEASHKQIILQDAWSQVSNFSEMEADILAVANSTELAGNMANFSQGFSGRDGGIYGIPLSADIEIFVVDPIDVTTPIKFTGGAQFPDPVNGLVIDNDITDLLGTDSTLLNNKSAYSSSTSDLRFNYTSQTLQAANYVTTPKLIEGNTYRLSLGGAAIIGYIGFGNNDTEEFFGIELDINRVSDKKIKGKSYVDILLGWEGNLSTEAGGHKHIIFYFSQASGANGAQNSQPGEYFIYTLDNPYSGREIKNSFTSGTRGMPRLNQSTSNISDFGNANPAGFWSTGQASKIRIYINDFGRVSGEFVGNGVYGEYSSPKSYGFQSQPGGIVTLDLNYLASVGYTGVSDGGNPYGHTDYSASSHITVEMAPNSTVFITDSAGPGGVALPAGQILGIILDLSHLRNGDTFTFAYDNINNTANGSSYNPNYQTNIILKYGSRAYSFYFSLPNYGTYGTYTMLGSTTTGEFFFMQPSGSIYNTATQSSQSILI